VERMEDTLHPKRVFYHEPINEREIGRPEKR
jgi:hypothetical protein